MKRIPILMYHNVDKVPDGLKDPWLARLWVTPEDFRAQMRMLKRLGYRGLSMSDALPYLLGEKKGRVAVITLDDGYVSNLEHALPVLNDMGFTATCYAVNASPGGYNHWDEARSGLKLPLMNDAQLREWHAAGLEVGAHTLTHEHLPKCDEAVLHEQVYASKAQLEDTLGSAVPQFCYPYGEHDDWVVNTVRKAGFSDATTTVRGRAKVGQEDRLRWPRIPVWHHHRLAKVGLRIMTGI